MPLLNRSKRRLMMKSRDELRDAAWQERLKRTHRHPDDMHVQHELHAFNDGFDAGQSESAWVAVKDRLPTENGIYNVHIRTFNKDGETLSECSMSLFFVCESKEWLHEDGEECEYSDVVAWMPIPPYTADTEGENHNP